MTLAEGFEVVKAVPGSGLAEAAYCSPAVLVYTCIPICVANIWAH